MERIYSQFVQTHFQQFKQMLFLAGPRQVGKTTISQMSFASPQQTIYLNWDKPNDRQKFIDDTYRPIIEVVRPEQIRDEKTVVILDELHKRPHWKNYLKGFYDTYQNDIHIMVTGSAKLNLFRRSNDSLMGRYLLCRVHPLSVRELHQVQMPDCDIQKPVHVSTETMEQLLKFGGFPESFLHANTRFSNNWQVLRQEQLFREDIRDLAKVNEVAQLEMLAEVVKQYAAQQVNMAKMSNRLQIAATTVKRWLEVLENFYFCFRLYPWHQNISRSLTKEPKLFLWDWSVVQDSGARIENMVACHLLKAVHFWNDLGLGQYALHYLRDLDKREVDFMVAKNGKPWLLVEVKSSAKEGLSKSLIYYQQQTSAPHAVQLAFDLPYVERNCFEFSKPVIVPVSTFLSQLV